MRIIFSVLFSILYVGTSLEAQVISPRLLASINTAAVGEEIPIIVTLVDKADLRPHIAKSGVVRMMSAVEKENTGPG
jgi:hypothetical protein